MVVSTKAKTQRYALITVHEEWDKVYRVPVTDEDDAWSRDPSEFTDEQLVRDEGGNIDISDVVMEDGVEDDGLNGPEEDDDDKEDSYDDDDDDDDDDWDDED